MKGQIACSLKRSSAASSRAEERIAPPRVAPMPRAIDRASLKALPLMSRSTEMKQGYGSPLRYRSRTPAPIMRGATIITSIESGKSKSWNATL